MLLMIHLLEGSIMSTTSRKKVDPDRWLEKQINDLTDKLRKQPENNRGPYVISNSMLTETKSHSLGINKLKALK